MRFLRYIDIGLAIGLVAFGGYMSFHGWDWWWSLLFVIYFLWRLSGGNIFDLALKSVSRSEKERE